jgi:hypothetical protein
LPRRISSGREEDGEEGVRAVAEGDEDEDVLEEDADTDSAPRAGASKKAR